MLNDPISDIALLQKLGKRLNSCRLQNKWTQAQLAAKSGVSKRTIERLESGESVQLSNWLRILRALSLLPSLDTLLSEAPAKTNAPLRAAKPIAKSWRYKDEQSEGLECYSRYKHRPK